MKKSSLHKKIKSYSTLAGSILAANSAINAQIVYTDIIPDSTVNLTGGLYNLDLNNDGTFDFRFDLLITPAGTTSSGAPYPGSNRVMVTPLGSNAIAGSVVSAYIYPTAMAAGDTVKPTLTWNIGTNQSMASSFGSGYLYGNWLGAADKFIGLKLNVAANTFYGWARLDVDSVASTFTIKDYAYKNNPGLPIVAGMMTDVGISENIFANNVLIYGYDNHISITLLNDLHAEGIIKITNILGQEIFTQIITSKEMNISLEDQKSSTYFVSVIQANGTYTKKINLK